MRNNRRRWPNGTKWSTSAFGIFQILASKQFDRRLSYRNIFINYTAGQPRDGLGYFVAFYLVALYFFQICLIVFLIANSYCTVFADLFVSCGFRPCCEDFSIALYCISSPPAFGSFRFQLHPSIACLLSHSFYFSYPFYYVYLS